MIDEDKFEDFVLFYEALGHGDGEAFANDTAQLVESINSGVPPRQSMPPSKLERERQSLVKRLEEVSPDLHSLIMDRHFDLYGPPPNGTHTPVAALLRLLYGSLEPNPKVSPRHVLALRLLWHCKEWGLSFPDDFKSLATELKPAVDSIGDIYALADIAEGYLEQVFVTPAEMGSSDEGEKYEM